jgi:hypothetical protein
LSDDTVLDLDTGSACHPELRDCICRLRAELDRVADLLDDILFDPAFKPTDADGKRIKGAAFYLLEHPVQQDHVQALREWFVQRIF